MITQTRASVRCQSADCQTSHTSGQHGRLRLVRAEHFFMRKTKRCEGACQGNCCCKCRACEPGKLRETGLGTWRAAARKQSIALRMLSLFIPLQDGSTPLHSAASFYVSFECVSLLCKTPGVNLDAAKTKVCMQKFCDVHFSSAKFCSFMTSTKTLIHSAVAGNSPSRRLFLWKRRCGEDPHREWGEH